MDREAQILSNRPPVGYRGRQYFHELAGLRAAEAAEAGDSIEEIVEAVTEVVEAEAEELKEDLTALTVAQLKERLRAAGLAVSGTKLTLINRLEGNE